MEKKFYDTVLPETVQLIQNEFNKIPEKYRQPFNSNHEGYAVMLEEVRELEEEIFFGEKRHKEKVKWDLSKEYRNNRPGELHREAIRAEAVQVAAMAIRIIQELT